MRVRPDTAPVADRPQRLPRNPGMKWIDVVVEVVLVVLVGFAVLSAAGTPQPSDSASSTATMHIGGCLP